METKAFDYLIEIFNHNNHHETFELKLIYRFLQLSNSGNSLFMLLMTIGYTLYSFGVVFIVCEVTQHVCDAINAFDMEISQTDWYLYPHDMKKVLPMIMNVTQKPVEFKWFGSMSSCRDTFRKVIRLCNIICCYKV